MSTTTEKRGYKYTEEFGYIPEDWEIKNIVKTSSLKARIGWQGLTTAEYLNDGDYLLVTGTDFDNGKINWNTCFYVEKNRYDQDSNIQIKNGDILITKDGTIGKVAYIDNLPKPTTLNSGVFVVRPMNEAYNTRYFYYLLQSNIFISFLNKLKAGSTIVHLYQKDLSNFDYIMPSDIKEQEKIAEVLGDIDSLIDTTQQLINKKKDIKTATMQKLFKISNTTKTDILKNIANIQRGASPRPIDSPIWFDRNSNIGWTRISDIKGKYIYSTEQKLSQLGVQNSRYVPIGSLIMSICATLGRPAITKTELCIHDGFVCFYDIKVDPEYVYYYLQYIQENWKNSGQTGSQANLNTDLINNTLIPLLDNQKQIATILSDMDAEIEALEKELSKYQDIKTGMMQELLTGKTRLI